MKFKIAVIGLLTAIFATCAFTSYSLVNEAKKQSEYQKIQALTNTAIAGMTAYDVGIEGTIDNGAPADYYMMYRDAKELMKAMQ